MAAPSHHIWGQFHETLRDLILRHVESGWAMAKTWDDIQPQIASQLEEQFGSANVHQNIPLDVLGVPEVGAQIDIVFSADLADRELGGCLIHVSGHTQPRHEKELLELMAVSLTDPRFGLGALIVCSDNRLRLEGRTNSFAYCSGPLVRLTAPILSRSNLQGILIVGLPTPC